MFAFLQIFFIAQLPIYLITNLETYNTQPFQQQCAHRKDE